MTVAGVFFGSIGTIAETSNLQRRAYNRAFAEFDLEWIWDAESYRRLLRTPGGVARVAAYADAAGDRVDARAVHAAKMRHFADLVAREGLEARPGVTEVLRAARRRGMRTALCSTTAPAQVDAILDGLVRGPRAEDFDWIGDATRAARPKPAPDIYAAAMGVLNLRAADVLVFEDTPESAQAAIDAGCRVVAFPGAAAAEREFQSGLLTVDRLQPRILDLGDDPRLGIAAE